MQIAGFGFGPPIAHNPGLSIPAVRDRALTQLGFAVPARRASGGVRFWDPVLFLQHKSIDDRRQHQDLKLDIEKIVLQVG
jgi:hypothetical protein